MKTKYFLDIDTYNIHKVPQKYWHHIDIIMDDNKLYSDDEVNDAKNFIVKNCKVLLQIDAMTQTL